MSANQVKSGVSYVWLVVFTHRKDGPMESIDSSFDKVNFVMFDMTMRTPSSMLFAP